MAENKRMPSICSKGESPPRQNPGAVCTKYGATGGHSALAEKEGVL